VDLILFHVCFVCFAVLGFEPRACTLSHSTSPFLWRVFFEIGSQELFAQAGFKPQWSWSLASWVAWITGVIHWHPAVLCYFLTDECTQKLSDLTHLTQPVSGWVEIHTLVSDWLQRLCPSLGNSNGKVARSWGPGDSGAGFRVWFGIASVALKRAWSSVLWYVTAWTVGQDQGQQFYLCAQGYPCIISFSPHHNPVRLGLSSLCFTEGETKAERGKKISLSRK
jgi:hypothetical protein